MNILDVNDNPPVIDSPFGYNVSVSEVSPLLLSFHPARARSDPKAREDNKSVPCKHHLGSFEDQ